MVPMIDTGAAPSRPKIDPGAVPEAPAKISFSFEYWNQMKYFGLDSSGIDWVVGFFDRIREISRFTRDQWNAQIYGNAYVKKKWRYHKVDWAATNIPIKKSDIVWVSKSILENDAEYPFFQFGLGAGGGRFAGFWETDERFAIVLLDPHHNLQPAGDFGYRVTDCAPQEEGHALLHLALDNTRQSLKCKEVECSVHAELAQITVRRNLVGAYAYQDTLPIGIDKNDAESIRELLAAGTVKSVNEILKRGISLYSEELLKQQIEAEERTPADRG